MARDKRFNFRLDEDTTIALRRLADINERSMAAQLRVLIRIEAVKAGVWTPRPLQAVRNA